jgi:hypothetical protein
LTSFLNIDKIYLNSLLGPAFQAVKRIILIISPFNRVFFQTRPPIFIDAIRFLGNSRLIPFLGSRPMLAEFTGAADGLL